jgi:hypothetical protein
VHLLSKLAVCYCHDMEKRTIIATSKKKSVKTSQKKIPSGYTRDFFNWTRLQASLLKDRHFAELDIAHLIEELESLGNSERNAIESHMIVLLQHLLKLKYQPTMRCKSWDNSVENAQFRIKRLVEKNPSLKKSVKECIEDAYFSARLLASSETGLDKKEFPDKCPWKAKELFSNLKL